MDIIIPTKVVYQTVLAKKSKIVPINCYFYLVIIEDILVNVLKNSTDLYIMASIISFRLTLFILKT